MPTRVVTLSHATGAGGETIGRTVAKALGFRYIDEEIINLAAQKEGIDAAIVADAERRKTFLARLLAGLGDPPMMDAAVVGILVPEAAMTRSETVRTLIVDAIHETAEGGQAVIVSHAASIPLAGRADVLRVLITASADTGGVPLPVTLTLCQTNPTTGVCLGAAATNVTTTIDANATPTFGIFVTGSGSVSFSPATNRIYVRFRDSGGVIRGATSVAVRTQ